MKHRRNLHFQSLQDTDTHPARKQSTAFASFPSTWPMSGSTRFSGSGISFSHASPHWESSTGFSPSLPDLSEGIRTLIKSRSINLLSQTNATSTSRTVIYLQVGCHVRGNRLYAGTGKLEFADWFLVSEVIANCRVSAGVTLVDSLALDNPTASRRRGSRSVRNKPSCGRYSFSLYWK